MRNTKEAWSRFWCKCGIFVLVAVCVFGEWGGVPAAHALRFEALTDGFSNLFGDEDKASVSGIFNSLFTILISVGATLAVLRIAVGGIKYMFSESFTTKEAAKKDLQGSVLGLLIIISVVLVFEQINDNILNLDVFEGSPPAPVATFVPSGSDEQQVVSPEQECIRSGGRIVGRDRTMQGIVVECEQITPHGG